MLLRDSIVRDHHIAVITLTSIAVLRTAQLALRCHNTTVSKDVSIIVNLGLRSNGLLT